MAFVVKELKVCPYRKFANVKSNHMYDELINCQLFEQNAIKKFQKISN